MATDDFRQCMAEFAALMAEEAVTMRKIASLQRRYAEELRAGAKSLRRLACMIGADDPEYEELVDVVVRLEVAAERAQRSSEDGFVERWEAAQRWLQVLSEEGGLEIKDAMSSHLGREPSFGELASLVTRH